jgi:hypothetical protein
MYLNSGVDPDHNTSIPRAEQRIRSSVPLILHHRTCYHLHLAEHCMQCSSDLYDWIHRFIETRRGVRFQASRVLIMLAESGLLYFIIQVIRMALSCTVPPTTQIAAPFTSTLYNMNRTFISLSFVLTVSSTLHTFYLW